MVGLGGLKAVVGLGGLGPTTNSARSHHHVNHNPNSNLNNASAHNRGNTGTHSNCGEGVNFRNNRVPLRHHIPGTNFGGVGRGRCFTMGLSALRTLTRTGGLAGVNVRRLGTTNLAGNGRLIGILNGNRLGTGLRIRTGTFSGATRRTVGTMNNGTAVVWMVGGFVRALGGY